MNDNTHPGIDVRCFLIERKVDEMNFFKNDTGWNRDCIVNAVRSMAGWVYLPSLAEVKITDLIDLFRAGRRVSFSYGRGVGDKAIFNATNTAISKVSSRLPKVKHIIYNVTGNEKSMFGFEIQESVNELLSWCHDNTTILIGIRINNRLKDAAKVDIWMA